MKRSFLYTKHCPKMNLQKITQSIYYSKDNDKFYRLNIMPSCTAFVNQDIQHRQLITLTLYDPCYLFINLLQKHQKLFQTQLPQQLKSSSSFLKSLNQSIGIIKSNQNIYTYYQNKSIIFNYLQKKVILLETHFDTHNPLERLRLLKLEDNQKTISQDTIILLKSQLNHQIVSQFVKERYGHNEIKKNIPKIDEEVQLFKPKPTKNNKKTQDKTEIPKNQQTLFSSWGKKKE